MKNRWIFMLLSLLGMAACGENEDFGVPAPMYGCPPAEFTLRGKVTDAAGNPIPGIRISGKSESGDTFENTEQTDKDGHYFWSVGYGSLPDNTVLLRAVDEDGPENGGEFETGVATVVFDPGQEVAQADFVLKLKTKEGR